MTEETHENNEINENQPPHINTQSTWDRYNPFKHAWGAVKTVGGWGKDAVSGIYSSAVKPIITETVSGVKTVANDVYEGVGGPTIKEGIVSGAKKVGEVAKDTWNNMSDEDKSKIKDVAANIVTGAISRKTGFNIPNIDTRTMFSPNTSGIGPQMHIPYNTSNGVYSPGVAGVSPPRVLIPPHLMGKQIQPIPRFRSLVVNPKIRKQRKW